MARPLALPLRQLPSFLAAVAVLLLALQFPVQTLAVFPALDSSANPAGFELQYVLHRPSGACTLEHATSIGGGAVRRKRASQAEEERLQGVVWVEEVELVREREVGSRGELEQDIEPPSSQLATQHVRYSASTLITLVAHSSLPPDTLRPLLLQLAEGLPAPSLALRSPVPQQACRSWVARDELVLQAAGAMSHRADVPEGMELFGLRVSGPTDNRVNLAFFSDGYTLDERDKFVADARRLANSIVEDGTFATTAPVLNMWGVFVPSEESGVGSEGLPKDTPFGLYREGHELRALYAAYRQRARAACRAVRLGHFGAQGGGCDQMALIGNSDLYGGLGGEFTITTRSELNGALVLRHEIGHSMINVGEEYEGGYAYFGVNSSPTFTNVTWSPWLTAPARRARAEDANTALQAYPWHDLSRGAWEGVFETEGWKRYPSGILRFSVAGLRSAEELNVTLNNTPIAWSIPPTSRGSLDRAWIEVPLPLGLPLGAHNLSFALSSIAPEDVEGETGGEKVVKQVCSVEVSQYGTPEKFESEPGFVGAFPTRAMDGTVTYRPTNEHCLMRMVGTPRFCSVCQEGLWRKLLAQIRLVDKVQIERVQENGKDEVLITPRLLALAHLRAAPSSPSTETYYLRYSHNAVPLPQFDGHPTVRLPLAQARGEWEVHVRLELGEVRVWEGAEGQDRFRFTV